MMSVVWWGIIYSSDAVIWWHKCVCVCARSSCFQTSLKASSLLVDGFHYAAFFFFFTNTGGGIARSRQGLGHTLKKTNKWILALNLDPVWLRSYLTKPKTGNSSLRCLFRGRARLQALSLLPSSVCWHPNLHEWGFHLLRWSGFPSQEVWVTTGGQSSAQRS